MLRSLEWYRGNDMIWFSASPLQRPNAQILKSLHMLSESPWVWSYAWLRLAPNCFLVSLRRPMLDYGQLTTFFGVFRLAAVLAIMKQFHSAFDDCLHPLGCGELPQRGFGIWHWGSMGRPMLDYGQVNNLFLRFWVVGGQGQHETIP